MKNLFVIVLLVLIATGQNFAKETRIVVRAKARDAKFIGSSLGGAYIIIRDKLNNKILSEGKTEGTTGDTRLIMMEPRERGKRIADEATAKYEATLDLQEPTFVRIEVQSPLNNRTAQAHVSTELWLIPGKHILGDGIILEIPGFIVDILAPRTHQYISLKSLANQSLTFEANIVMMCGCLIDSDGLWDANAMEVVGLLSRNGEPLKELPLICKAPNLFGATAAIDTPGNYELVVYAYDELTGNTGVDKVNFVILD